MNSTTQAPMLDIKDLKVWFPIQKGVLRRTVGHVRAVDGVNLSLQRGETLGIVGESGCGKTTLGRTMVRLIAPTAGRLLYRRDEDSEAVDLAAMNQRQLRPFRRDIQIIFQDPFSSLNDRLTVERVIAEPMQATGTENAAERRARVAELLEAVGLSRQHLDRYPHEFSGGQRQRIAIARALAVRPKLIVCDEPVSALDVSIQSQILNLLVDLQREFGLSYLFIAHDLAVVKHISDRIAIMYLGQIAETGTGESLYRHPLHPYTQSLISAIPVPDPHTPSQRQVLTGDVPSPINPPSGCRFHTRCPLAEPRCKQEIPEYRQVRPNHWVACHLRNDP